MYGHCTASSPIQNQSVLIVGQARLFDCGRSTPDCKSSWIKMFFSLSKCNSKLWLHCTILLFFVAQTMATPSLRTRDHDAQKTCTLPFMVLCQVPKVIMISCGHHRQFQQCKLILELQMFTSTYTGTSSFRIVLSIPLNNRSLIPALICNNFLSGGVLLSCCSNV